MAETGQGSCFHCGLPVPPDSTFKVRVEQVEQAMCCRGCQAVAQAILDNGLAEYYRNRTAMPGSGQEVLPEDVRKLALYDHPEIQRSFVIDAGEHAREAVLILEGITCAACIWLNERHLRQLAGVIDVDVNYASHRARVRWDDRKVQLSRILQEIQLLGYNAHPYNARQADELRKKRRKKDLQRIAIAGIAAAQVMMLAVALYAGSWYGIDDRLRLMLRWFSLLLTIPVTGFAAIPFYRAAWSGIRSGHLNMDVPVALAIIGAFVGSVWVTVFGGAQVYYDTIAMFTLFLLATRMLETGVQEKSIESAENLLKMQPAMALRLRQGRQEYVPVLELEQGDLILSKAGDSIAADGEVVEGISGVNESLLTGESRSIPKRTGDKVIAGSTNLESPLTIRVTGVGEHTVLAGIVRLVDKAQAEKPHIAQLADRVASWFTLALLVFTALVLLAWLLHAPGKAFEVVLSVLVVTCPCALSLAVPAALAAASSHLIRRGILVLRGHALESLAYVTHVVFDKTGTLTLGQPRIAAIRPLAALDEVQCLRLAASLERASGHPLAHAFALRAEGLVIPEAVDTHNVAGCGMIGQVEGEMIRLGNRDWLDIRMMDLEAELQQEFPGATLVWMANAREAMAVFVLHDPLRDDAAAAVAALRQRGVQVSMLSGDDAAAVGHVAARLGISQYRARMTPADKLTALQTMQRDGGVVAMVGDGVNDAPVLAGAQVSFAMGTGADVASQTSDIVLLSSRLGDVDVAVAVGRAAHVVMRQNLWWAVIYNLAALPFAAMGYVAPWVAALGMSVSSLIVVLNALRLR